MEITDIPRNYSLNKIDQGIIYKEFKFDSLTDSFNKAKDFLDKSSRGILINNKAQFKSSENPKVTAIIPVYNSEKFINRAIKSIQNKNLLDIEIILVNDCSKDKSLSIIKKHYKKRTQE